MNIMLIAPSGAFAQALSRISPDDNDRVIIVTRNPADTEGDMITLRPAAAALTARSQLLLGGSALGRNLLRVSPLDAGRRFSHAAQRDDRFRAAAASADVIVALERDAILTAWTAARRWAMPTADVVYGVAPAQVAVDRRSS